MLPPAWWLGDPAEACRQDLSVRFGLNGFLEPKPFRPEPKTHGGHQETFGSNGGVDHFPGERRGAGHRLFADDMLSRFEGSNRQTVMNVSRRANINQINLCIRQQLV